MITGNEYISADVMEQSCCFTGHRVISSGEDIKGRLVCEVETLINSFGVRTFYAGGALGFDTLAAECVLGLKGRYPFVRLVLALPCKNQAEKWSLSDRERYERMLSAADEVYYVSECYTADCMHRRNDYMVEHSKYCICYLRHSGGGTYYTVNRAKVMEKELIML
ncbi:MAG: DUF1273 family protein [Clostridia bacterium]|nr:DUF1273 family protein [Clostridia bacterium]